MYLLKQKLAFETEAVAKRRIEESNRIAEILKEQEESDASLAAEKMALAILEENKDGSLLKARLKAEIDESNQRSVMVSSFALDSEADEAVVENTSTEEVGRSDAERSFVDYASVQGLPFRQLRKECEIRSLEVKGNTATLRRRLLEHSGYYVINDETNEGPSDIEVRRKRYICLMQNAPRALFSLAF